MASENDLKSKIMQTTPRQKFIMLFIVVVVLIIMWQIAGLFGGESSSSPVESIKPVSKMNANVPGKTMPSDIKTMPPTAMPTTGKPSVETETDNRGVLTQGSIVNDPQFVRMQRITEEKYMGKLNELEELRIQRQIAETNQAIAAAKLATVTAEKDISDLLTRPAQQNFNAFSGPPTGKNSEVTTETSTTVIPIPPPPEQVLPYTLVSVSMLLNKWNAVISFQGTMYTVSVGDILPPDGSVVTSISKNSVTIKKGGKARRIGITTSI